MRKPYLACKDKKGSRKSKGFWGEIYDESFTIKRTISFVSAQETFQHTKVWENLGHLCGGNSLENHNFIENIEQKGI